MRRFKKDELRAESYLSAFYQLFHLATLTGIADAVLRDATDFVKGRTRAEWCDDAERIGAEVIAKLDR